MNRLVVLVAVAALAATGCTDPRSGSLGPAPTAPPPDSAAPAPTAPAPPSAVEPAPPIDPASPAAPTTEPTPPAAPAPPPAGSDRTGTITIQLWFTRDGRIAATRRTRPATVATSRLALTELAAGPTAAEARAGLTTAVPANARFTVVGIGDGVATVDYTAAFYAGGRDPARLRQAQVVYTLTQFATVDRIAFQKDGEPAGAPVGRADYADLLPPIVVLDPVVGQRVASPITVTGTANVFEATVSVRLLDAAGREVAAAFTTATCGSGCRGSYRLALPYRSATEQRGTLQVYEVSAKDGSRINVVAVPVTLTPR